VPTGAAGTACELEITLLHPRAACFASWSAGVVVRQEPFLVLMLHWEAWRSIGDWRLLGLFFSDVLYMFWEDTLV